MSRALVAALLVVATALLAPVATADHAYSHRFVFEGRLLDAEGLPIPDVEVAFYSIGQQFPEACPSDGHRPITDENGDFRFCFHAHELDPNTRVGVIAGNATLEKAMDTAFRRTVVTLVDAQAQGVAPAEWEDTFSITGKVWRSGSGIVEGVPVFGNAVIDAPVNLTLALPDGSHTEFELATDGFGDFDATFRIDEDVNASEVRVLVESMGMVHERSLDLFSHRSTVGFFLPAQSATGPGLNVNFPSSDAPAIGAEAMDDSKAPGARSPAIPAALVAAVGLGAVVMLIARRNRG